MLKTMTRVGGWAGLVLIAAGWTSVAGAVHPTLASLAENTWVRIDSRAVTAPDGILAFSGMAYDDVNRKILLFGGGHNDYWGNEIWALDTESLKWTRMYQPDHPDSLSSANFRSQYPGAIFNPPDVPLSEARPITRHTYDTVEFISSIGQMFTMGKYTWGNGESFRPYCWGCRDTWTYDVVTNKWTYRNLSRASSPGGLGAAAYDPVTDLMFVIEEGQTWAYNVHNDQWTRRNPSGNPINSIETVAEYDSKRQVIYLFGGEYPSHNQLWRYNIAANSWTRLEPTGQVPPGTGGYGLAYDRANDVLIAWNGGGIGTYVYNPNTNHWSKQNPTGGEPNVGGNNTGSKRTHGRLKYDPVSNVTFLVSSNSGWVVETWAYRYGNATVDTTPPSVPTGLAGTPISGAGVQLNWNAASDPQSGVTGYRVFRNGTAIATRTTTSFSETGLNEATTYGYQVSAINGAGLESARSATVQVTTFGDTVAPTITSAVAVSATQINLVFSEPVAVAGAQQAANYILNNGAEVIAAVLDGDTRTVRLTTTALASGLAYTLTVNNILDRATSPNMIAPNSQVSVTYSGSSGSLVVSGASPGNYQWAALDNGVQVYIDRAFTFTAVPQSFRGLDFLRTANNDKDSSGDGFIAFTVNQAVDIHVAYDVRPSQRPAWLADWTDSGAELVSSDTRLRLYRKSFPMGEVLLGGNQPTAGADYSMYVVVMSLPDQVPDSGTGTDGTVDVPGPGVPPDSGNGGGGSNNGGTGSGNTGGSGSNTGAGGSNNGGAGNTDTTGGVSVDSSNSADSGNGIAIGSVDYWVLLMLAVAAAGVGFRRSTAPRDANG